MCFGNKNTEANDLPASRPQGQHAPKGEPHLTSLSGLLGRSDSGDGAVVKFQSCRYCSDQFTLVSDDGRHVHIIAGLPKPLLAIAKSKHVPAPPYSDYKTISYVWGQTTDLPMHCINCKANFTIPMQAVEKFLNIISLASNNEYIWLDAVSINQEDPNDKAAQISQMGKIYAGASTVAVLLPRSDNAAFQLLSSLAKNAHFINENKIAFTQNEDSSPGHQLTETCEQFFSLIEGFEQKVRGWNYWERAWTFQEWAMARNIDLGLEGSQEIIRDVKYAVLHAATLISIYKMQQGPYGQIRLNFPRGEIPKKFNTIKRLFPDELAFVSPDDSIADKEEHSLQNLMPSLGVDKILGLRTTSPPSCPSAGKRPKPLHELFDLRAPLPPESMSTFTSRLSIMLNAFATSKRKARFEADQISCWASMCDISYAYSEKDSYGVALQKVLAAIREKSGGKIRLYAWNANTNSQMGAVDLDFLEYARLHVQSNGRNPTEFPGTPLLSGRADTIKHMEIALRQHHTQMQLPGRSTLVQRIIGAGMIQAAQMDHIDETIKLLKPAISGSEDGILVHNVVPMIRQLFENTPIEVLSTKALVVVTIDTKALDTGEPRKAALWTIIPFDRKYSDMMVGRECVNGQLVLVVRREDRCDIVGFLTFTDQLCGTYLAWCDIEGRWITRMTYPERSDIVVSGTMENEMYWAGKYELSKEVTKLW